MSKAYKDYWKEHLDDCAQVAREYLAKHPRNHKYRITCRAYDGDMKEWLEPVPVTIELTDDEYVAVMSYMLSVCYNVTFNAILFHEPAIAKKINDQAIVEMENHEAQDLCPFIIQFDEFRHDLNEMPIVEDFPF
jgi:hypothetical protein